MATDRKKPSAAPQAPRLYLVTPPLGDDAAALAAQLSQAAQIADVAAVLLRLAAGDERALIKRIKVVTEALQPLGVAVLVDGHDDLVARGGADGAHLGGIDALTDALPRLRPSRIAGCGGLHSRHDAMLAAEVGADYVLFGEPDRHDVRPSPQAVAERVAWWAEVFEAPCVGYAAALDEIGELVAARADFVALGEAFFTLPGGIVQAVRDAATRLVLEPVS